MCTHKAHDFFKIDQYSDFRAIYVKWYLYFILYTMHYFSTESLIPNPESSIDLPWH